jgi:hypothetical protein
MIDKTKWRVAMTGTLTASGRLEVLARFVTKAEAEAYREPPRRTSGLFKRKRPLYG